MSEHSVSAHCTGYNEQVNACLQDASGAQGKPKTRPGKREGGKRNMGREKKGKGEGRKKHLKKS